jgi:2-polyprenyl-3-methyl-5-hydroxy-6-metoxy-1,4-benzoquinol methylase
MSSDAREELRRRIAAFPRWHYALDLDGITTPVAVPGHQVRHAERRRYFFDPLVRLCGGSLRGRSVLDLGCNAGFWSLAAVEHGCDRVCGIDGRAMHVEQAELVFEVKRVPPSRYRFVRGDVLDFDLSSLGSFDVVLCLGLLYHVNQPVQLLTRAAGVNSDILLIDTTIHPTEEVVFALRHDEPDDPRNALASSFVLFPSPSAVIAIVRSLGYHGLVLKPDFDDYVASRDFLEGRRRAFLCARTTDLSPLLPLAESSFG